MQEVSATIRVTYDKDTDNAYIYFEGISAGEITLSMPLDDLGGNSDIVLDFNKARQLKGIEIIGARGVLPQSLLARLNAQA